MVNKDMRLSRTEVVSIDKVKPYWRNPRRVTDEAVNMLRTSIESYGYQQPIVVDSEYVIIVGHTRYSALRKMGETEIRVMVADDLTPAQVKQYRVIDNRAGEYSTWDYEKLMEELQDSDRSLATQFFPEIDFGDDVVDLDLSSKSDDTEQTGGDGRGAEWDNVDTKVEFVCPSCFHGFTLDIDADDIKEGKTLG